MRERERMKEIHVDWEIEKCIWGKKNGKKLRERVIMRGGGKEREKRVRKPSDHAELDYNWNCKSIFVSFLSYFWRTFKEIPEMNTNI